MRSEERTIVPSISNTATFRFFCIGLVYLVTSLSANALERAAKFSRADDPRTRADEPGKCSGRRARGHYLHISNLFLAPNPLNPWKFFPDRCFLSDRSEAQSALHAD